jgi:hypothetical protein
MVGLGLGLCAYTYIAIAPSPRDDFVDAYVNICMPINYVYVEGVVAPPRSEVRSSLQV